jgi:hypothetical protein
MYTYKNIRIGKVISAYFVSFNYLYFVSLNRTGFFAAASFISFQHCLFNFGREPFKYPPKNYIFNSFNDFGVLTETEKIILPRRKKLDILRETALVPNACSLCCDNISTVMLIPCNHKYYYYSLSLRCKI